MPRSTQFHYKSVTRNCTTWELEAAKSAHELYWTGNDGSDGKGKAKEKKAEMTDCPVCDGLRDNCNAFPKFYLDEDQKPSPKPYARNLSCKGGKTKVKPKKKKGEVTSLPLIKRPHFEPGTDWHTKGGSKYLAFRDTMAGGWTVEDASRELVQNLLDQANVANDHRGSIVKESVTEIKDKSTKDESEDESGAGPAAPPKSKIKSRLIQFRGTFSHDDDDGILSPYQKAYLHKVCKFDSGFKGEKLAVAEIEFRYDRPAGGNWHITSDEKTTKINEAGFTEVRLTNFGVTSLPRNILDLGYSSKSGDSRLIGKHGDGLKAGLAVFVRNGITVEFENGYERWRCGTRPRGHGMYNIIARKNKADPLPFAIILRGPAEKLDSLYEDIRNKFLTLASPELLKWCVPVHTHPTVKGRLLLHESHKSCIYIKGVFVCKMDRLKYGIDVSGGCDVGRDRDTVDVDNMLEIVCKLWAGAVAAPYLKAIELTAAEAKDMVETVHVKDVGVCIKSATGTAAEKLKPGMHIAFKDGESTYGSKSVYLKDAVGKVELKVSIEVVATVVEEASAEEQRTKRRRTATSTKNPKHPSPRKLFLDMLYADAEDDRHPWEEVVMIDGNVAEELFSKSACQGIAEEFDYRFGPKTIASGPKDFDKYGDMLDLLPEDHRQIKHVSSRLSSVLSQVSRPSLHGIIKMLSTNLVGGNHVHISALDDRAKEKWKRMQYTAKNAQFGELQIMDVGAEPCLRMWSTSVVEQEPGESVVYVSQDMFNGENIESLNELTFKLKSWECHKRGIPFADAMIDAYSNAQKSPYFSENEALLDVTEKTEEVTEDDAGEADEDSDDADSGPDEEEFMWLTVDRAQDTAELKEQLRERDANDSGAKALLEERLDALLTDRSDYIKTAEDIQNNYAFIKRPSKEEWDQRDYVLTRAVKNGMVLSRALPALQDDSDIVIAAVTQNGLALEHASAERKNDRAVVIAAVTQNGLALEHASAERKNDRAVVIAAVTQNGLALEHASAERQKDHEAVKAAFLQNESSLQFAGYQACGVFISELERLTKQIEQIREKHTETNLKIAEKLADSEAKTIAMTQTKGTVLALKKELQEVNEKLATSTKRGDGLQTKLNRLTTGVVHHLDAGEDKEEQISFEEAVRQKRRREEDAKVAAERLREIKRIKVEKLADAKDELNESQVLNQLMINFDGEKNDYIDKLKEQIQGLGHTPVSN